MYLPLIPACKHQRFSLTDHMRETLVNALEDVARDVGMVGETKGLEKLQDVMTEAKEKVKMICATL